LEAAEALCLAGPVEAAEVLEILSSLVNKSLIVFDTRSAAPRYDMLETTRACARHRLVEHHEFAALCAAHATHFRDFLLRANTTYGKPSVPAWLANLEPELDNLRAALHWSVVDKNDVALGAAIAAAQHATFLALALNTEYARLALTALGPAPNPRLEAPLQLPVRLLRQRRQFRALCRCRRPGCRTVSDPARRQLRPQPQSPSGSCHGAGPRRAPSHVSEL